MTWTVRQRTAWMDAATADITHVANTAGIVVVAAFVTALVTFRRRTRWALLLLLALPIELAGFLTVNYAVGRPRPHVLHLGSTPSTFSWPSGHVAATVVLYGGLAILAHVRSHSRTLVISTSGLAALLTIAIAVSRVYRGEHHPTDVFAGLFLGIGALATAVVALQLGAGPSVSPRLTQGQQMARVS
jgi:membrane-associated phospholipid phosphatase